MSSRLFIVDTNVLVAGLITSQPSSPTVQRNYGDSALNLIKYTVTVIPLSP